MVAFPGVWSLESQSSSLLKSCVPDRSQRVMPRQPFKLVLGFRELLHCPLRSPKEENPSCPRWFTCSSSFHLSVSPFLSPCRVFSGGCHGMLGVLSITVTNFTLMTNTCLAYWTHCSVGVEMRPVLCTVGPGLAQHLLPLSKSPISNTWN